MQDNPPQPLIRVTLPDPAQPGTRMTVGYVESLDDDNRNFRLIINDPYRDQVGEKLEDVLFSFDQPAQDQAPLVMSTAPALRVQAIYILRWICGGGSAVLSLLTLLTGHLQSFILFGTIAVVTLPPFDDYAARRNIKFTLSVRILIFISVFFLLALFS